MSTSGACLEEALERYKRYERRLNDQVKPTEETLRKLNTSSSVQNYLQQKQHLQQQQLKSNFQAFPNGGANLSFEDASSLDVTSEKAAARGQRHAKSAKQLPAINRMVSSAKVVNKAMSAKILTTKGGCL